MRHLARAFLMLTIFSSAYVMAEGVYSTNPLADDGIHDPANDAIGIMQQPGEAMADFPVDRRGAVNWVKTLQMGKVTPRTNLLPDDGTMVELSTDILMKKTAMMPHVRFPHLAHTQWLACNNCHPDIFIPQYKANPVTMEKILKGEFCGRCHHKVAFSFFACERCHNAPHENSLDVWVDATKTKK